MFQTGTGSELWRKQSETICFKVEANVPAPEIEKANVYATSSRKQLSRFQFEKLFILFKKRITHGRSEIWDFSSSVQFDILQVSAVNE